MDYIGRIGRHSLVRIGLDAFLRDTVREHRQSTTDQRKPITGFNVVGCPAKHDDVDGTQIGNDMGARLIEKTCE